MIKVFKVTAILEGISYLALFFNMFVIKNTDLVLYKTILPPLGWAHGILFIGYLILAVLLRKRMKWTTQVFGIVLIASILPFATFYVEKKYLENA